MFHHASPPHHAPTIELDGSTQWLTSKTSQTMSRRAGLDRSWADAVRRKDYDGILRSHAADFVMFDVPPPFKSVGLDAYRKTWDVFFSWSRDPVRFDIQEMDVTARADVAFAFASMRCEGRDPTASPRRSIFV